MGVVVGGFSLGGFSGLGGFVGFVIAASGEGKSGD